MRSATDQLPALRTTADAIEWAYQQLDRVPYAVLAIPLRLAVATVFWNSAMTKLSDWNAALSLFEDEYKVPLLPPELAANLAFAIEITTPVLLVFELRTSEDAIPTKRPAAMCAASQAGASSLSARSSASGSGQPANSASANRQHRSFSRVTSTVPAVRSTKSQTLPESRSIAASAASSRATTARQIASTG